MTKKQIIVKNFEGLHAIYAVEFFQTAAMFEAKIWLQKENSRRVNAKDWLQIFSLAVLQNDEIQIIAEGKDEKDAVDTLCTLVESF